MPDDAASLSVWGGFTVVEQMVPSVTVQCHAANLLALPNGDVLCAWFGGTQEGLHDIDIYLARLLAGATEWSAPSRLSGDRSRSEQNPVLFLAPNGELWLFWTAQVAGQQDVAEVRARVSRDLGASWGDEATIFEPDADGGVFVRQPPVVRSDGAWILPVFRCGAVDGEPWTGDGDHSAVRISSDEGRTWREVAVPSSEGMVHMCIVPTEPGGPFVALFRSRYADHIHRSRSDASGERWSAPEAIDLPNNNSSIQAINWSDHEIAMVYNHSSAADATSRRASLYDEIEGGEIRTSAQPPESDGEATSGARRAFWGAPRAPLSLATSADGGRTWNRLADLGQGDGYCLTNNSRDGLNRELSYPSLAKAANGELHVAFTHHRTAIKHLRITPGRSGGA